MADSSDPNATPRPRRTGSSNPNATPRPLSDKTPEPPRRSERLARLRQAPVPTTSVTATAPSTALTEPDDERDRLDRIQGSWVSEKVEGDSSDNEEDYFSGAAPRRRSKPVPDFGRYDAASTKSLFDLLHTEMPPPPDYYSPKNLKGENFLDQTKTISKTEINQALGGGGALSKLVYAPNMFTPLLGLAEVQLKEMKFDSQRAAHLEFASLVHPWHTTTDLPPYVRSEKDTEDWVDTTLLRPALTAALAYTRRSMNVPHRNTDAKQPADAPECWKPKDPFYISSSDGENHVVPDAIVATDEHEVRGTVEVKTSRALMVRSVYSSKQVNVLEELQKTHTVEGIHGPGFPIKFNWPGDAELSVDDGKWGSLDKQTRIIVQVYTQMKMKQCKFAMLSSYETSIFFYLRESDKVLFFSPEFRYTSNVFLATYCWVCLAIDVISADKMDLPEVKRWWPSDGWASQDGGTVAGVVPMSVPGYYD